MKNKNLPLLNLQFHGGMNNPDKDTLAEQKQVLQADMNKAMNEDNAEEYAKLQSEMADITQQMIIRDAELAAEEIVNNKIDSLDQQVLANRGVRVLTKDEKTYYNKTIEAMKSSAPEQALKDLDVVMPKTVIDAVFDDLIEQHELLNAINFQNTSGLIEVLVNTNENQLATWSPLCAEIVEELTGGFKLVNMELNKLSAFLPICKAMLDLGPVWLDKYVRTILAEAIAFGLEEGIINGDGNNKPIGMTRQVHEEVNVVGGVYPEKEMEKVTDLSPVSYGNLIAEMAETPNGKTRVVSEVILIVSPTDYLRKIMPATTIRSADGTYVNNVLPFPTKVIQSVQLEEGKAVIGIAKRYFMGIGTEKSGRIEHSDHYRFLEDERVYLTKLYGHGEPLDNNAFKVLDISELNPAIHQVEVKSNHIELPEV